MSVAARVTNIVVALACCVGAVSCSSDRASETPSGVVADTSVPAPDRDSSSDSLDGPASDEPDIELLAGVLLTPDAVGVPDTWAIRDLDPDVQPQELASEDADLAFGVMGCPLGPPATGVDGQWLGRRFAAPADPLDNGLLAVEIIAEVHDDDAFARRLDEIDACVGEHDGPGDADGDGTGDGDGRFVTVESTRRSGDTGEGPQGVVLTVGAAPSGAVAFPSRHAIAVAHSGQRTVTVVFSGVDQGEDWGTEAVELADRVLDLLDG
jgi:hypothetical protein